jgi:hypothetical protein
MKQTVYFNDFHQAFVSMDRGSQFSYEALELIYDYLLELEQDTGWEIELDVIAICCDYSEMTPQEVIDAYGLSVEDDGNQLNNVLDYLHDHTSVCGTTEQGTIVFQQF